MPIKHWIFPIAIIVTTSLPMAALSTPIISGPIEKFVDGDTFQVAGQMIRLAGIDTPEHAQSCKNARGKKYSCGDSATNHLKSLIGSRNVECEGNETDAYRRLIGTCFISRDNVKTNINLKMVQDGWAVAFVKFDKTYQPQELEAMLSKRGLWAGEFTRPAEFRSNGWSNAAQENPDQNGCVIKGNINRKGVKIYHTPWSSKHYRRTKINVKKGERWFCDEAEALEAGWRAPWR